ncbi:MAG: glucan biosynthesis protein [Alphaproteobacteria bacterium]|nr:glucan biosynthesis protein [Alphaproteobacteria bacterium]
MSAAARGDDGYAAVERLAAALAAAPAQPPPAPRRPDLARMNYDQHRAFRQRAAATLWRDGDGRFAIEAVPAGYLFPAPVAISIVDGGAAAPLEARARDFVWPEGFAPAADEPVDLAGFRILHPLHQAGHWDEVAVFLGASYFRLIGRHQAYGASARGLAIDAGLPDEEFPAFRRFWILRPPPQARALVFHALLDSPSVAGAYRFVLTPGDATSFDVEAVLFFRRAVRQVGYAPLTSMFWRGPGDPRPAADHRPQVHDSDGLQILGADAQWRWRALANPRRTTIESHPAPDVLGFGLIQRERRPQAFRDDEALYAWRPSLFVTPLAPFGAGAVQLLLLPTHDEYADNVGAFWTPAVQPAAGSRVRLHYRVAAIAGDAPALRAARAVAASAAPVDCADEGGCLRVDVAFAGRFDPAAPPTAAAAIAPGTVVAAAAQVLAADRAHAVLTIRRADARPATLRVALHAAGRAISETWIGVLDR